MNADVLVNLIYKKNDYQGSVSKFTTRTFNVMCPEIVHLGMNVGGVKANS